MKKAIMVIVLSGVFLFSCGKSDKSSKVSKTRVQKQEVAQPEMTVEKSAQLESELASLLMEKYWQQFKGKEYAEVKQIYAEYEQAKEEILKKYGLDSSSSRQKYTYWQRDHRDELKEYRKMHPDLDFYTKYPEYQDTFVPLYHYSEAKFKEKNQ